MSTKNPVHSMDQLKKLVKSDDAGRVALKVVGSELEMARPRIRADCLPGGINEQRPCPWYGCRHHLGLEMNPETGSLTVRDMDLIPHTCVLDVSEVGSSPGTGHGTPITLEEVGEILDVTRERARQIEVQGLIRMKPLAGLAGLDPEFTAEQWADHLQEDEESSNVNGHNSNGLGEINGIPLADDGNEG